TSILSRYVRGLTAEFFFSSRSRHTRSYGDWSSDVCSSDLHGPDDGQRAVFRKIVDHERFVRQMHVLLQVQQISDNVVRFVVDRRSEERRLGKECRSGWWREQYRKKG